MGEGKSDLMDLGSLSVHSLCALCVEKRAGRVVCVLTISMYVPKHTRTHSSPKGHTHTHTPKDVGLY